MFFRLSAPACPMKTSNSADLAILPLKYPPDSQYLIGPGTKVSPQTFTERLCAEHTGEQFSNSITACTGVTGEFVKTEIPEPSPRDTNSTNLGEAAFLTSSSDAQTAAPNLDYRTVGTH